MKFDVHIWDKFAADDTNHKGFRDAGLMTLLKCTEATYGYIPVEAISILADRLDIPRNQIVSIIKNNDRFHEKPEPEYVIRICGGAVCGRKDSGEIFNAAAELLGIDITYKEAENNREYISETGKVSLGLVGCIGACSRSAVITVNDEIYSDMTTETIREILKSVC